MAFDIEGRSGILYWGDVLPYFKELRDRYLSGLRGKEDREVWMALGKIELLGELENLPDTLELIAEADKEHQARMEREEKGKEHGTQRNLRPPQRSQGRRGRV